MGQIIGITGVIIMILIVVATISYRWYLKSKEKRTILKKWTMAYPQTTVVRQVHLFKFQIYIGIFPFEFPILHPYQIGTYAPVSKIPSVNT